MRSTMKAIYIINVPKFVSTIQKPNTKQIQTQRITDKNKHPKNFNKDTFTRNMWQNNSNINFSHKSSVTIIFYNSSTYKKPFTNFKKVLEKLLFCRNSQKVIYNQYNVHLNIKTFQHADKLLDFYKKKTIRV